MTAVLASSSALQGPAGQLAAGLVRLLETRVPGQTPSDLLDRIEDSLQGSDAIHRLWPSLVTALRRDPRLDRGRIAAALRRAAARAGAQDAGGLRGLAHAAYACLDLSTAQDALDRLATRQTPSATDLLLKARCQADAGALDDAVALCDSVLARQPRHPDAIRLRRGWARRLEGRHGPWRVPVAGPGGLLLDPLHPAHAMQLAWQYRDPDISHKTLLPPLDDPAEAPAWIERRLAEAVKPYALLHPRHGLVGYTELLDSPAREAFLCLWIGTDWQRRGLGQQLIAMACGHAFDSGMELVLTAAFEHNAASLHALRACGFRDLDVRACAPDDDRRFLYRTSDGCTDAQATRRLVDFCTSMKTGLAFPPAALPPATLAPIAAAAAQPPAH
jgi:RimJ/RimL family protein N-acetyltransferase